MNQTREKTQNGIVFITDIISVVISYYMSGIIWLYGYRNITYKEVMGSMNNNIIIVMAAYVIAYFFYSHNSDFIRRDYFSEIKSVIKLNAIMAAVLAVYELLSKMDVTFARGVYIITIILNVIAMFIIRILVKNIIKWNSGKGDGARRLFIITNHERAERARDICFGANGWMGKVLGMSVIDKDCKGQSMNGIPVVADVHSMLSYIKNEVVDDVYINLGVDGNKDIEPLVMKLEDMGVTVHIKLDVMEKYQDYDSAYERMGRVSVITFANRFYDYRQLAIKRIIDIAGSLVGIVIMLIAMIFVVPAIKLESKGPVFFKQKRVGKNGRYFYVYKFRSMYQDAEERKKELMAQNEMQGLMFKMKDDPRITKVGKFIRETSIDELPQFINVFMGDMSLVGTRPPTVNEFKQYEGHHKRRLSMKPGITGMWQAYGRSTVKDFEDIVAMDLDYIDHWSLGLDFKIMLRTVKAVFEGG